MVFRSQASVGIRAAADKSRRTRCPLAHLGSECLRRFTSVANARLGRASNLGGNHSSLLADCIGDRLSAPPGGLSPTARPPAPPPPLHRPHASPPHLLSP